MFHFTTSGKMNIDAVDQRSMAAACRVLSTPQVGLKPTPPSLRTGFIRTTEWQMLCICDAMNRDALLTADVELS
jgi:hypothetical protein